MTTPDAPQTTTRPIVQARLGTAPREAHDCLAIEAPLEIRLQHPWRDTVSARSVSITMRTPGHDLELAVGFLYTEGILRGLDELDGVQYCGDPAREHERTNVVRVDVNDRAVIDWSRLQRHVYTSSSCGVCGKTSLEAVAMVGAPTLDEGPVLDAAQLPAMVARLRDHQEVFERTGGLHAAASFGADGALVRAREDVGRHNALDKLVGASLLAGELPLAGHTIVVSGRASFELVQKAVMAGASVLVAVSAPSSLACELAEQHGMTLIGFARGDRFNVYTHPQRVRLGDSAGEGASEP